MIAAIRHALAHWRLALACAGPLLFLGAQSPATAAQLCPPTDVRVSGLPAGQMRVTAASPCRANQSMILRYAGYALWLTFDKSGALAFTMDCFAGAGQTVQFEFDDGETVSRQAVAQDMDSVVKIAVIWRGAVNLDLHILEYAAHRGQPGHVWAQSPGAAQDASARTQTERRSFGFMSTLSAGARRGDNVEVYTLWRAREQTSGVVATALDYESRARPSPDPESCGSGLFAEIDYEVVIYDRGLVSRTKGGFSPLPCGQQQDAANRYHSKTIPDFFFR